jgi:polyisoprenoid-binding protein YceI
MTTRFSRTIFAVAITALMVVGNALPASAASGVEHVTTYYNNAQHSEVVGEWATGCYSLYEGRFSGYSSTIEYSC